MANRKSIGTFDKKIEKLKATILKKENEIKVLKEQVKSLEGEKKQKEIEDLQKMISTSGKSIEEIREFVSRK